MDGLLNSSIFTDSIVTIISCFVKQLNDIYSHVNENFTVLIKRPKRTHIHVRYFSIFNCSNLNNVVCFTIFRQSYLRKILKLLTHLRRNIYTFNPFSSRNSYIWWHWDNFLEIYVYVNSTTIYMYHPYHPYL